MPQPAHLSAGVLVSAGMVTLCLLPPAAVRAARPEVVVPTVPSVEDVVLKEGFTPTLSQSDTYRPGVVLVRNARGTHDEVIADCIGVVPTAKVMSQSSIATSLSAGVSARLLAVRGEAAAGIEKRLTFVDPEQRTIPLGKLEPTAACREELRRAERIVDLTNAILVYDVLVAQIQNTVCTRADAQGGLITLGAAEASAYAECVQESDAQVPLGYKSVPLRQVLAGRAPASTPSEVASVVPAANPGTVDAVVEFEHQGGLGVAEKLKAQTCEEFAKQRGAELRAARIAEAEASLQIKANTAWLSLVGELDACTKLPFADRATCISAAESWLSRAKAMPIRLSEGSEVVQTDCGVREPAFPAVTKTIVAKDVAAAEVLLSRLKVDNSTLALPAKEAEVRWTGKLGYEMVSVPAGTYQLGCTAGQSGCDTDESDYRVKLTRKFLIGRTEVTQGLYLAVTETNPSKYSICGKTCPVESVSWFDAIRFSNMLSMKEGLEVCYSIRNGVVHWPRGTTCTGYRLPTEAEWEVAARAGMDTLFAGTNEIDQVAWYEGNAAARPHPVGKKVPNTLGLVDMTGNVWEWVWDWYAGYAYAVTDPIGPNEGSVKVLRGGSWINKPEISRISYRYRLDPGEKLGRVGFRLVRTIP